MPEAPTTMWASSTAPCLPRASMHGGNSVHGAYWVRRACLTHGRFLSTAVACIVGARCIPRWTPKPLMACLPLSNRKRKRMRPETVLPMHASCRVVDAERAQGPADTGVGWCTSKAGTSSPCCIPQECTQGGAGEGLCVQGISPSST